MEISSFEKTAERKATNITLSDLIRVIPNECHVYIDLYNAWGDVDHTETDRIGIESNINKYADYTVTDVYTAFPDSDGVEEISLYISAKEEKNEI